MDFEKQIEDLEIEIARLKGSPVILNAMTRSGLDEFEEKSQMRYERLKEIDSQLEELRNQLAKNYKEDITKQEAV